MSNNEERQTNIERLRQAALNAASKNLSTSISSESKNLSAKDRLLQKALEFNNLSMADYKKDEVKKQSYNLNTSSTSDMNTYGASMHGLNSAPITPTFLPSPMNVNGFQQSSTNLSGMSPGGFFNASSRPQTPITSTIPTISSDINKNHFLETMAKLDESEFFIDESLKYKIRENTYDINNFPLDHKTPVIIQEYAQLSLMWKDFRSYNYYYKCKKMTDDGNKTYLMKRNSKIINSALPTSRNIININHSISQLKDMKSNPSVLNLHSIFLTSGFMDNSLVQVYEYYPYMIKAHEYYNIDVGGTSKTTLNLSKKDLWYILFQFLNFLKFMFKNNLHKHHGMKPIEDFISLDQFFVIENDKSNFTLKYNNLGDMISNKYLKIENDGSENVEVKEVTKSHVKDNEVKIINKIGAIWKSFLIGANALANDNKIVNMLNYLLSSEATLDNINAHFSFDIMADCFDRIASFNEVLYNNLSKGVNNEDFLNILMKLNIAIADYTINDSAWQPNGAKYPLKLFYDYLFKSNSEKKNSLNYGHIMKNLCKLDSNSFDSCLLSDETKTTCIVVSYKDLNYLVNYVYMQCVNKNNK
ncbi:uncharacterized protein HGUI_03573 [Hanseniaspora guilliermondii]|uniref:Pan3 C-terminal knob domain-containing protein n=1 Tax=Hanseniaspora guilliermondii TaxID=56406 RepID=A0A1L0B6C1_9ASCO|nr:uncharacterized protein HGUI_03573 [Hanseniaspora guilliermondii]